MRAEWIHLGVVQEAHVCIAAEAEAGQQVEGRQEREACEQRVGAGRLCQLRGGALLSVESASPGFSP
eukprot:COSAG01_NODE_67242_length_266_cov_1.529762_1_plen_66_part_10